MGPSANWAGVSHDLADISNFFVIVEISSSADPVNRRIHSNIYFICGVRQASGVSLAASG